MPHDAALNTPVAAGLIAKVPFAWRGPLMKLAAAWLGIFALTFADWLAMGGQWWNISTYNHILFVPPIVIWLVYSRRRALAKIAPQSWWPGLVALAAALFLWLIGSLAGANSVSQFGAVLALQSSVLVLLGPRVVAACLFPLAYLVFLVPFGDELVPLLQMITADLVIMLTHLSGIPAVIDGVFIDTPAGLFEVAEACSGVKFLIAMAALGTLVAYTCFRSWPRRISFMAAAIILPIFANGVRAWGTIYIAQFQGVEFAEGFDHVFYGWIFFALVVGALIAASWRWFDRDPDDIGIDFPEIAGKGWFQAVSRWKMAGGSGMFCVLALLAVTASWSLLASRVEAELPDQITLPQVGGWTLVDYAPTVPWEPKASGADHRLLGRYRNQAGQEADVFIAVYAAQGDGREASAFGEGALDPDTPWRWLEPARNVAGATSDYLFAFGKQKRLVETTYHVGDLATGSAVKLKLANMRDRLLLRERPTMLLILSAEQKDGHDPEQELAKFRQSIGDSGEWMDRIVGLR